MIAFRPFPVMTAFAVPAFIVLLVLGGWQLERRQEKRDLLDAFAARAATAPAPLFDIDAARDVRFQQVMFDGAYWHAGQVSVAGVRGGRPVWRVVTPFALADSRMIVLVERGVVPQGDPSSPAPLASAVAEPAGTTVTGVVRPRPRSNMFTPAPDLEAGLFYAIDAAAIVERAGSRAEFLYPHIVAAIDDAPAADPPGLVRNPPDIAEISNRHLEYALTWFALAAALVGVFFAYHAKAGRLFSPK